MSNYTVELRHILETYAGRTMENAEYASVNQVIAAARPLLFDFDFPMFDEHYRGVLETKIMRHYYMREIGFETLGQFKLKLETRLNEVMPYYNQLYKSELIEFNPMYDVDLTTEHKIERAGEERRSDSGTDDTDEEITQDQESSATTHTDSTTRGDTTNTTTGQSKDRYSDTPQGSLQNIENDTYLTNARIIDNTDNTSVHSSDTAQNTTDANGSVSSTTNRSANRYYDNSGNTDTTSTEDYLQTVKGKNGGASYSQRLQEFRQTFLNIDMQVIDELNDLFMLIW